MTACKIALHQIYYQEEQIESLGEHVYPFNNCGISDPRLEYGVIRELHDGAAVAGFDYWGAISWKFESKTGLKPQDLMQKIQSNPGFDAYYLNPSLACDSLYPSIWVHGEEKHPGLMALTEDVLRNSGLALTSPLCLWPSSWSSTCNYIVGNRKFWSEYLGFVDPIIEAAIRDPVLGNKLIIECADPRSLHRGASFLPFLVERLMTVFMASKQASRLKFAKILTRHPLTTKNRHLAKLLQLKESCVVDRSEQGRQLWVMYRNWVVENVVSFPCPILGLEKVHFLPENINRELSEKSPALIA